MQPLLVDKLEKSRAKQTVIGYKVNMNDGIDETRLSQPRITSSDQSLFVPGQIVGSKFKIISRLGAGGMGTVYRVEQIFLKQEFALKTMDQHAANAVLLQRFQIEAQAACSLNHPNLVKVHDFGILDDGNPYLVMDYIDGMTLAEYLKKNGSMPIEQAVPLFLQACFGLMAAHEHSIVHRDIKPGNLMLLNNMQLGTEGSVKLVDFGIAKLVGREEGEIQALTRTGEIFGSPLYMSPEQCSSGTVDQRSDIYSLGCVLFEMLTGTPPHMGQSALRTMMLHQSGDIPTLKEATLGAKQFPDELELIVAKMLQKFPEKRYQNVGLVAHDLTMLGREQPQAKGKGAAVSTLSQTKPVKMVSMPATKFYRVIGATNLLSAAVAAGCVYFFLHELTEKAPTAPPPQKPNVESTIVKTFEDDKQFATKWNKDSDERMKEADELKNVLNQLPPIQEQDVVKDGKKQHLYHFPSFSLGEITLTKDNFFGATYSLAKGDVAVPVETEVGMIVHGKTAASMIQVPSIFKKIPGKDFKSFWLSIPTTIGENEQLTEVTDDQMKSYVLSALKNLNGWTNLEFLYLKDCTLSDEALVSVGQFRNLKFLEFEFCRLDEQVLIKQKYLMDLKKITLIHTACKVEPILMQLTKSENLESIAHDRPIPISILHELENCKNLHTLEIITPELKDRNVEAMCRMKNLRTIALAGMQLTPTQLTMLINCPWLTTIKLSKGSYSNNDIAAIQDRDKRIKF